MSEYIEDEELIELLKAINVTYGSITIETLKKAHSQNPELYPSYKMFERRFGGIKAINKTIIL